RGVSREADNTFSFIRSLIVTTGRGASVTATDLVEFRVAVRGAGHVKFFGKQPPQCASPRGKPRPAHPEQLQGCLVEFGVRTLGGDPVGQVLKLVHKFKKPVSAGVHRSPPLRARVENPYPQTGLANMP